MGGPRLVVVRKPDDLPPLLAAVIDAVVEEAFCSEQTIGDGPSWDVYHAEAHGLWWSIAVRMVDDAAEPYVEYLIAPVGTCEEALPKWRAQALGPQHTVN